ncbi:hypothetical protein DRN67_00290, partial [Candidatus Micrarchaeota archaeon]
GIKDIQHVCFYEKPFLKFERILYNSLAVAPRGHTVFLDAMLTWLGDKMWIDDKIKKELGFGGKVQYCEHHESHAASTFLTSPYKEAAVLTVDGAGEWATATIGEGKDKRVRILKEIRYPNSLGLLYTAFTYYLGFRVNSGEYKLMGLAPYGEPTYYHAIVDNLIDIEEDGAFKLNTDYFGYLDTLRMTNKKFHDLFGGEPRKPSEKIEKRHKDIARSIQMVTEEIMLKLANTAHDMTGQKNLVLAGGVALNCVANGRILREGPFENLYIQPASGDAGGAVGAASLVHYSLLNNARQPLQKPLMKDAYLGPAYSDEEIEGMLQKNEADYEKLERKELFKRAAKLISQKKVVGWFQGRMEFGPRALGSRSILADPRYAEMRDTVNLKIKFRESFRPFAPTVLEEDVSEWFELDRPSPYMLLVAQTRPEKRKLLPAITHVDGSARIQTVSKAQNALFHGLIKEFKRITKVPVVINTSFNVRGEPIVCTPQNAYDCFTHTYMDYLAIGDYLVSKKEMPADFEKWRGKFEPD